MSDSPKKKNLLSLFTALTEYLVIIICPKGVFKEFNRVELKFVIKIQQIFFPKCKYGEPQTTVRVQISPSSAKIGTRLCFSIAFENVNITIN